MNNRELLELAAKAVNQERSPGGSLWSNANGLPWDPFKDDGDAIRLAINLCAKGKIRMEITQVRITFSKIFGDVFIPFSSWLLFGDDKDNETFRRSVTKVAAEIGRSIP